MNNLSKLITVILSPIVIVSCGEKKVSKKEDASGGSQAYKTMRLQHRQMSGNVQLPGVMQPFEFVSLYPKLSGFVKSVSVDRGSVVKKGQVLIKLEAPEIEEQVAAAKLKYSQAQATYVTSKDRYRRLLETSNTPGTVSSYDLEAARSKMQGDSATAQGTYANYKAQETMMGYLTVTAPFDGVITERNVHPGALVGPGAQNARPMLVLQQVSKLRLVVDVPEQYAMQVSEGGGVHYTINAQPGKDFTGIVTRSSQSLSSNFRAETIEIDVANDEGLFKPGMYAEVVLPTSGSANAFIVPKTSVVTTTERKYVIALQNNKTKWVDVSEGNQGKDSTEIFCSLGNGDEVIINGNYEVRDGQKIKQRALSEVITVK